MIYQVINADNGSMQILDGEHKIQHNFKVKEFACNDGNEIILISHKAVAQLQLARNLVKKELKVLSAFRTHSYNDKIDNASDESQHMQGKAFDLRPPIGYTPEQFGKLLLMLYGEVVGYHAYDTFVHIDFRGLKARW